MSKKLFCGVRGTIRRIQGNSIAEDAKGFHSKLSAFFAKFPRFSRELNRCFSDSLLRRSLLLLCVWSLCSTFASDSVAEGAEAPRPKGSVIIFDDGFSPGVREYFSIKNARSEVDSNQPMFGKASWLQIVDPKQSYLNEIYIRPALAFCGVEPSEDLRRFRQKGALVFWVRSSAEGLSSDIGFKMLETKNLGRERMPENLLPLHHYVYMTRQWSKVIIPLADFSDSGFVMTDELIPDDCSDALVSTVLSDLQEEIEEESDETSRKIFGELSGRQRRSERFFHWGRVGYLVQRGRRTKAPERRISFDRVMLVREYDREEYLRLRAAAKKHSSSRWSADAQTTSLYLFRDDFVAGNWAYFPPSSRLIVDETVRYNGKKSIQFAMQARRWAGGGMETGDVDLTSIRELGSLAFWVKGKNGGEVFTPYLRSRRGQGGRVTTHTAQVRHYRELTTEWQEIFIPLADFPDDGFFWDDTVTNKVGAPFDWTRVIELYFEAAPIIEVGHPWYMDDMRCVAGK